MDDHGIVDLLKHYEPTQILVSIYALSKLQLACQVYERSKITMHYPHYNNDTNPDLTLLQDLYDCIPFATAAYGWKFNLATAGQFHKSDVQALVKMTQVDRTDIVTVNWEARPNRPVRSCNTIGFLWEILLITLNSHPFFSSRHFTLSEIENESGLCWPFAEPGRPKMC